MKIKKIIFPVLLLGLVACGTPNSSKTSEDTSPISSSISSVSVGSSSTSSGSVGPVLISDWDAETKTLMTSYIGEVLPVAPFTADYELDDDGYMFYIGDEVGDITATYRVLLEAAGYIFESEGVDEFWGGFSTIFSKQKTEYEYIVIEVYYEADYSFSSIFGWIEDSTPITDWDQETKDLMVEYIGEILPVAPFTVSYGLSDYDTYFMIEDVVDDITEEYGALLIAAGYTLDSAGYNEQYATYESFFIKQISEYIKIVVEVDFEDAGNAVIYGWISDTTPLVEWTEEIVTMMMDQIGEILPFAPFTMSYYLEEDPEGGFYLGDFADDIRESYGASLEVAGYELVDSFYDEDGDCDVDTYTKAVSETLQKVVQLVCYGDGYFQIGAWMEIGVGEPDVSITSANVTQIYSTTESTEFDVDGLKYVCIDIMKSSNNEIQFKRNSGAIYNITAADPIKYIVIEIGETNSVGSFVVSAGMDAASLTAISPIEGTDNIYDLDGATFFKIESKDGAVYADSIGFIFVA